MLKEAGSFFAIALILLVGACVYIEAQGGNPFAAAHQSPVQDVSCKALDYRCIARDDAIDNYISADLFERQINQESGFNPYAISPAGAIGIAQIVPSTAEGWGVDPHDPVASLAAAAKAMARYNNQYGSYQKALSSYNCGTDCTNRAVSQCGANWRACVPVETDRYIRAIMGV
jgi:soluble lytic murein transglycosylase-like protein